MQYNWLYAFLYDFVHRNLVQKVTTQQCLVMTFNILFFTLKVRVDSCDVTIVAARTTAVGWRAHQSAQVCTLRLYLQALLSVSFWNTFPIFSCATYPCFKSETHSCQTLVLEYLTTRLLILDRV